MHSIFARTVRICMLIAAAYPTAVTAAGCIANDKDCANDGAALVRKIDSLFATYRRLRASRRTLLTLTPSRLEL